MAEHPYMPVRVAALLADTTWMTTEEFGAYGRILFTMWANGGRLTDQERDLARIAGLSLKRWRKVGPRLMPLFTAAGGQISQKRLTATWLDVQERRVKRIRAASKVITRLSVSNGLDAVHAQQCTDNQNQNKKDPSFFAGREIGAEELARLKQSHLPLGPVVLKQRGGR